LLIAVAETLTFLFTDIEGSTSLWERFPDAMKDALKEHDAILQRAVAAFGGRVVKSTGDGTLAVFGGAFDAVGASLAAQHELAAASWPATGPLRVRIGIHSGQADQRANDFFGPTVNRAARIMAAGHGGQVLVSAAAASLATERLPPGASFLDLGEHRLRGIDRAERIFQLVHPALEAQFPPLATVRLMVANLPARATIFVGRAAELAEIKTRLADPSVRLLTLIGPGGTGKTALAIRTAEDIASSYPDGECFVDLSNSRDSNAVLLAMARGVGLDESADRSLHEELTDFLRGRRALLVLDNFEQVTEAAGAVARLLSDCPQLKFLATSREALHVRAEQLFHVAPLTLPAAKAGLSVVELQECEAVQLFIDRAQAVRPGFRLTEDNAGAVAEICRRLDGLPLAIELAAARLRLLSPDALRKQLYSRLNVSSGGPRDLPERQQTLRAAIDWSYEILGSAERRLFELMSVFADADLVAVEAVAAQTQIGAGEGFDTVEVLTGLVDKSLVRQVDSDSGEPRMAMLETIREFAGDRLNQDAEANRRAHRAHALYYAGLVSERVGAVASKDDVQQLDSMAVEAANLRIAWDYWVAAGDLEELERMARALLVLYDAHGWYLDIVKLAKDMLAVLDRATSAPNRAVQEIALRTILARALMTTQGFTPEVEKAYVGAVKLFEQANDVGVRQKFTVLRGLFSLYQLTAQADATERLANELMALAEREGDVRMRIDARLALAAQIMFADPSAGVALLDEAISFFPDVPARPYSMRGPANDPRVSCLTTAAFGSWFIGRPDKALERANQALELAAALKHPFTSAYAEFHVGLIHTFRREFDIAHDHAAEARQIGADHGFQIWNAIGGCLVGVAQTGMGHSGAGVANIEAGLQMYRELRSPPVFWPILLLLASSAYHRAGRHAEGLRHIEETAPMVGPKTIGALFPEFQIAKGDLLASGLTDGQDTPEALYLSAFDIAGAFKARMPQLRAATRLARSWRDRGEGDRAVQALAPLYSGFDEGLATADLCDARDVLSAIAPSDFPPRSI
jgi:predicted ATPase/class 3 adenylate cyclase